MLCMPDLLRSSLGSISVFQEANGRFRQVPAYPSTCNFGRELAEFPRPLLHLRQYPYGHVTPKFIQQVLLLGNCYRNVSNHFSFIHPKYHISLLSVRCAFLEASPILFVVRATRRLLCVNPGQACLCRSGNHGTSLHVGRPHAPPTNAAFITATAFERRRRVV